LSKILLARHGSVDNQAQRFLGRRDIPLNEAGIRQAEQLRDRLAAEKLDFVYSSPLKRALTTAKIIASGHKVAVTLDNNLCECDFGEIEGLNYEEIKERYPALALELSAKRTGAFPGGETIEQLNERVIAFLKTLEKHRPEETLLVVAHGGPVRLAICNLLGLGFEHWIQFRVDYASLSIVETYPGMNILDLFNDVSHLKD
jgi:alpha-ribazole phosphatase